MPYGPPSFASILAVALLLACGAAHAGGPEPVEFSDGEITLKALVFRPEGAGPFPAVVAMHDCTGLTSDQSDRPRWEQIPRMGTIVGSRWIYRTVS
jgi:hypothetical protein